MLPVSAYFPPNNSPNFPIFSNLHIYHSIAKIRTSKLSRFDNSYDLKVLIKYYKITLLTSLNAANLTFYTD